MTNKLLLTMAPRRMTDTPLLKQARKSVRKSVDIYQQMFNAEAFTMMAMERSLKHKSLIQNQQNQPTVSNESTHNGWTNNKSQITSTSFGAGQRKRITLTKYDVKRRLSLVTNEEERQWKTEHRSILSLLYFNSLILAYNIILLVYASIDMARFESEDSLIVYQPVLTLFQILMIFNFTLRYYKLARIMHIYFNTSTNTQLKHSTPQAIRRNRI